MVDVDEHRDVQLLVDALEVAHDLMRRHRVERGNRLVRQDDGRGLVERARQRNALLLAAGELVAAGVRLVEDADLVKRLERLHLLLLREQAQQHAEKAHVRHHGREHVLDGGGAGDQVERLEDHADLAAEAAHALAVQRHHIYTVDDQLALGDVDHAVDGADEGGFAGAGQTDDRHKFALIDRQIDVLESLHAVGIGFAYVFKLDQVNDPFCPKRNFIDQIIARHPRLLQQRRAHSVCIAGKIHEKSGLGRGHSLSLPSAASSLKREPSCRSPCLPPEGGGPSAGWWKEYEKAASFRKPQGCVTYCTAVSAMRAAS